MARTKASPPKQATGSKAAKETATAPRRSPRKAVQSAKKIAADEEVFKETTKRTPKQKPATTARPSTKSSPKKAVASKVTKSPPKKTTASIVKTEASPSPKRGRPKKVTTSTARKVSSRAPSESRISSRTRSQTPPQTDDQPNVPVPDADRDWTDSPRKRSPSKSSSKKVVSKTVSARKVTSQEVTKASTTGVRKSIELPEADYRGRSSSPVRKASVSPVRGRSKTAASPKARANSATSNTRSTRAQSQSPARKASKTAQNALALSRAASLSPVKDKVNKPKERGSSRSRSPVKDRATNSNNKGTRSGSPAKAITSSPKRRETSRSRSPAKSQKHEELLTVPNSTRGRSKSPRKPTLRKPSEPTTDVVLPPIVLSPRQRGRPRILSAERPPSPLQIKKSRTSRSPAKTSSNTVRRSRSASPQRQKTALSAARRRSDPSPARGRERSASPAKAQIQQYKSPGRSTQKDTFIERFNSDDEYGRALQDIEDRAYTHDKDGVDPWKAEFLLISEADRKLAVKKGRDRANLQSSLRRLGGPSKDQVRRPSKLQPSRQVPADIEDMSDELSDADDLTSQRRDPRRNAIASQSGLAGRRGSSPQRSESSTNPQLTPKRGPAKSQPSGPRSPSRTSDDAISIQEPTAKGRGVIVSVTNPQHISGTNKRINPFFETMPAPEIWHRRMPPFLPFGETPFMEKEMSRQISEDLGKGAAEKPQGYLSSTLSSISNLVKPFTGKTEVPASTQQEHKSPWTLPDVEKEDVNAFMKRVKRIISGDVSPKRKASEQSSHRPVKVARRRSHGSEPKMSGALQ